jgi:hypothetical protein
MSEELEVGISVIPILYEDATNPRRNVDAIAACRRLPQRTQRTQRVKKEFGAAS